MSAYTTGDHGIPISGTCTDAGTPIDLTGATIELHLRKPGNAGTLIVTATPTGDPGQWTYNFADGDLDTAGNWAIEAQVTRESAVQTFGPATFTVTRQIA